MGEQFFKISQGDLVLAFNPVSKDSKSKVSAHFGADIAFITTNFNLFNGVSQLSHGEREPFVISGPGDYEVKETFIKGTLSSALISDKPYINTIYSFVLDNMKVVFLGAISNIEIGKESREHIDNADILFIPIGGNNVSKEVSFLDTKNAVKLINSIEPKLVIPMSYDDAPLKSFLKELGGDPLSQVDKLTIKSKDLIGKEASVVVLEPSK